LRNRLRVELKAPATEVWALIGDFSRYPEYSLGLERVEAKLDRNGAPAEYLCHFKGGALHREIIRWYEPNRGYASRGEEPDPSGLKNLLTLVTLTPSDAGTILTWDEYYDAQDLPSRSAEFEQALADIGKNLVARFGGRYVLSR